MLMARTKSLMSKRRTRSRLRVNLSYRACTVRLGTSGRRIWPLGLPGRRLGIPLRRGDLRRRLLGGCRRLAGIAGLAGGELWEFCERIAQLVRLVRDAWLGRGRLGSRWRYLLVRLLRLACGTSKLWRRAFVEVLRLRGGGSREIPGRACLGGWRACRQVPRRWWFSRR